MTRPTLSFFVHDLASNPLGRAIPIARALESDYDIELVGFLLSGDEIYAPYRGLYPYHTVRATHSVVDVTRQIPLLASKATGHVIVACKPLLTTLGPALWASRGAMRRPVILDVEDDEWVPLGKSLSRFLWRDIIKGWRHATAWKYTLIMHPLTHLATATFVVSEKLQRRYGGTLLRHGPDERMFDPDLPELGRTTCRVNLGLPDTPPLALFAGLPQPHKGWSVLLDALQHQSAFNWHLVLVGDPRHPDFARAKDHLGERCHLLGYVAYDRLPSVLAAIDAVPVPNMPVVFSESQVSAKALDALAMKRPLLASRVGDYPRILGEGEPQLRGWLHTPGDPGSLAHDFESVATDPTERRRRVDAGREWFLKEASASVIRQRFKRVCEATLT